MQLALRKSAPSNATPWQRFACWVIKARLASEYCHGGIVIDGALYHSTSSTFFIDDLPETATEKDFVAWVKAKYKE